MIPLRLQWLSSGMIFTKIIGFNSHIPFIFILIHILIHIPEHDSLTDVPLGIVSQPSLLGRLLRCCKDVDVGNSIGSRSGLAGCPWIWWGASGSVFVHSESSWNSNVVHKICWLLSYIIYCLCFMNIYQYMTNINWFYHGHLLGKNNVDSDINRYMPIVHQWK